MAVGPQTAAVAAGVGFEGREFARLVPLRVAPGEAGADQVGINEVAGAKHAADFAAVAVRVRDVDADGLAEDRRRERVAGLGAKGLGPLGSVDAGQADLVLVAGVSSRVSVSPSAIFTTWPTRV